MSTQNPYDTTSHRAPKKHRGLKIAGGVAVVAIVIAVAANMGRGDDDTAAPTTEGHTGTATVAPADETSSDGHTLTFLAETSDGSTGSVTYLGDGGQITQQQDAPMPWRADVPNLGSKWDALGANMNVQQDGSGDVTCRVLWDGEEVASNTSSGAYAVASCSLPSDL